MKADARNDPQTARLAAYALVAVVWLAAFSVGIWIGTDIGHAVF